jgi:hypothetical protein
MRSRIDTEKPPASIPTLERMKTKQEIEVDVFTSFAEVSGLLIRRESIVHQNPPLPDILCAQEDGTRVAFELTELVDNGFMRRLGFSTKCKDALRDCLRQELDIADSAHFTKLYHNARLVFHFAPKTGDKKRLGKPRELLLALLAEPEDFTGNALLNDSRFSGILSYVRVFRGLFVGPIIDTDTFGGLGDPTEETIRKKLTKTYPCPDPIQLLAYYVWDLMPPEESWKESAARVSHFIAKSQFERIWLYDHVNRKVAYVIER